MAKTARGHIQKLSSGSFRVHVYAGTDPVTASALRENRFDFTRQQVRLARNYLVKQGQHIEKATPVADSTLLADTLTTTSVSAVRSSGQSWLVRPRRLVVGLRHIGRTIGRSRTPTSAGEPRFSPDIGQRVPSGR